MDLPHFISLAAGGLECAVDNLAAIKSKLVPERLPPKKIETPFYVDILAICGKGTLWEESTGYEVGNVHTALATLYF
jgi:hypothetical protein